MNTPPNTVKQDAYRLYAAGLNLLPIKTDGSKTPALATWAAYTRMRAGAEEMEAWFGPKAPARGLAVVCGETSGNYIIVDGDMASGEYLIPLAAVTGRLTLTAPADLLAKWEAAPVTHTPTGAWHKHLRCTEPVGKGGKLAMKPTEVPEGTAGARLIGGKWTLVETLIETRAQGQIAVLPPSPPACHPSQKPYVLESGDLTQIPVLTPAELETVLNCSRSFNEFIAPEKIAAEPHRPKTEAQAGEKPGDAYNRRGDREALLERHGWQLAGTQGEKELWTRPGKSHGISATFNHAGCGLLYPFSTNADPLESEKAYSPFALYAALDHGGDFSAAAKALYAEGYGDRVTPAVSPETGHSRDEEGGVGDCFTVMITNALQGLPVTLGADAMSLTVAEGISASDYKRVFHELNSLRKRVDVPLKFLMGDAYWQIGRNDKNEKIAGSRGLKKEWVESTFKDLASQISKWAGVASRWEPGMRPRQDRRGNYLAWSFFDDNKNLPRADKERLVLQARETSGKVHQAAQAARKDNGLVPLPRTLTDRLRKLVADKDEAFAETMLSLALSGQLDTLINGTSAAGETFPNKTVKTNTGKVSPGPAFAAGDAADVACEEGETFHLELFSDADAPAEERETFHLECFSKPPAPIIPAIRPEINADFNCAAAETTEPNPHASNCRMGAPAPANSAMISEKALALFPEHLLDENSSNVTTIFPYQSQVAECLRERSWPRAWERWMRFSGWQNGQPVPDEVGQQLAALRPLWDAQHPSTKDSATTRREAAHA